MSPNSLIFLVIIGIWAAYLTKYWVRRREHLATARSMDRFSEAMRVLQSSHLPRTDVAPARPTSYALAPEKLARPQVTVKRAATPAAAPIEESPVRSTRRFSRGFRGVTLLVTLALIPTIVVLAWLSLAPWWGVAVVLANVVAAFGWLRQAVQQDITAKRQIRVQTPGGARPAEHGAVRSPLAARPSRPAADPEVARRARRAQEAAVSALAGELPPALVARVGTDPVRVAADPTAQVPATDVGVAVAEQADLAGVSAPPAVAPEPAVPAVDDDDIPLTWDPRPVPAPTYTLKARAEHARPEPLAVPTPEPIPAVSFEDDGVQAYGSRTAAG